MSGDRPSQHATASGSTPGRGQADEPTRIGSYRIIEKRGEGGMGIVYLAEQTEPVKRQVALKVIKLGMDSAQIIARFEAERQALALMDHPAIASIHDAGTTPEGRPYFVMEYVQGSPITEHCDRHKLTNRDRIELFLQVCEGVQHAHQKAVIHRDLKPSNVLVSLQGDRPVVKIIDFGLAKALAERLTDRTLHTELGMIVGTLEYMSPEQAGVGHPDVDTRSDVYSLGVMLYELLVGIRPLSRDPGEAGIDDMRRKIREQEPMRPSARVSAEGTRSDEWASRRRTAPQAMRRELQGDLDWITMRALEKDRARRYQSPSELAADLRRFLSFEPVLARAPSTGYRVRKFVRRHRLGVAAAAVMAVSLGAGTIGSTVGFVRARRAEVSARTEAESKKRVADFLKDLFKVSDPSEARGSSITARELLDKAAGTIDTQLVDQPEVQAELARIMGDVYMNLGLYAPAESLLTKALDIQSRVLGPEHPDTLASMASLGFLYGYQSRNEEAERLQFRTLEMQKRVLGREHAETLRSMMNLASAYHREARYAEAEQLYSEAIAIQKRVLGPEHADTVRSMYNLALLYYDQRRYDEAGHAQAEVLEIRNRLHGPEHPDTLLSMAALAKLYRKQRRFAEAEQLGIQVLEIQKRILGEEHPRVLGRMSNLALLYHDQGRYDEALRLSLKTLEIQRRVLGPEHEAVLWSMNNVALSYQSMGRLDEAERLHTQTLEIRNRLRGPRHADTLTSVYNLACVSALRGDRDKAMARLRQNVEGGYIDAEGMAADTELQSLHGPEFDALLAQVRRNASAARADGGEAAKR
ncbi:MAG: tetratricopeptide repeat protein [Candidatus Polarisedimenticolia bacterium]